MPLKSLSTPAPISGRCTSRYKARIVAETTSISDVVALRALAFGPGAKGCDPFDDKCIHLLIEEQETDRLVCCARLLVLESGEDLAHSYSSQFYDLAALSAFKSPMAELGRFCIHPDWSDPDILRLAWAKLAELVDDNGIGMLFGCSSFVGTDTKPYVETFALLQMRHLAPVRWLPRIKAANVFRFSEGHIEQPDEKRALRAMPPLLRSYLMMGGWVSDHAVVDRQMNTLHVFTGLEIDAIPLSRKRLLRF